MRLGVTHVMCYFCRRYVPKEMADLTRIYTNAVPGKNGKRCGRAYACPSSEIRVCMGINMKRVSRESMAYIQQWEATYGRIERR